ncbi:hypothetical protein PoB_005138000 [Plakobranchus ocellatus]|uniref:Uncharacterized protein n=1 Tax=Plakobranchus ocellatus TaxID=259542 RepID=A0AAV4BZW4_9GAST|nr:hypothetical protein PoB_005138000 [Plakobranchus ocellatus]
MVDLTSDFVDDACIACGMEVGDDDGGGGSSDDTYDSRRDDLGGNEVGMVIVMEMTIVAVIDRLILMTAIVLTRLMMTMVMVLMTLLVMMVVWKIGMMVGYLSPDMHLWKEMCCLIC